jgi:elongator complex protein 3
MNFENIILKIIEQNPQTEAEFYDLLRKETNKLKITIPPKRELISAYQNLLKNKRAAKDAKLEKMLRKASVRTLSGVAIVTSLTMPYNCPGNCIYCPLEAKMPKSYLSSEPAAARALGLKFDPYEQMRQRILMLEQNGHPTDKIEYIIKGGTWNYYPLKYQYWFILQSFRACNELSKKQESKKTRKQCDNVTIKPFNHLTIKQLQGQLNIEQRKNERSKHRIIGLTLETRPDFVTPENIFHMRQMGATRIELGLQAPDDKILKLVDRGHTVQQFKNTMLLLRQAGFKVDLHFMPDLPGTTPKHDVEMYKQLFSDPGFKPDMVKIYPCTVIKTAPLYKWHKVGKYKPYSSKKLFEALIEMKANTPRYCRISRLIRDIPDPEIVGGNKITNLRQDLKKEMEKRGLKCQCLRCREIGHTDTKAQKHLPEMPDGKSWQAGKSTKALEPKLFIDKYETEGGTEYFLSYENKKRQMVFAFLRLRLPDQKNLMNFTNLINLKNLGFIRELHTYGQLVPLKHLSTKAQKHNEVQHTGFGKKLVQEAEKIAKKNKYKKISVISGVGVRGYYRKLGYRLSNTYMVKNI